MSSLLHRLRQLGRRVVVSGACAISLLLATAGPALAGGSDWGG